MDGLVWKKFTANFDGRIFHIRYNQTTGEVEIDGHVYNPKVEEHEAFLQVSVEENAYKISVDNGLPFMDGYEVEFSYKPTLPKLSRQTHKGLMQSNFTAPLPSVVVEVHVRQGDKVKQGDSLITLEAMKMRNSIRSDVDGEVTHVQVREGQIVDADALLVIVSPDKSAEGAKAT